MIKFERHILSNGLRVISHYDSNTPMATVNMLYRVGARNEEPGKTGFAHLFEHLMFAGSAHAPSFDEPLERAGGENNAFTNNDITNYYEVIPAGNIETALFLESDRLQALNINAHSLEVQRKVVMEEFKENYLNQPYGDTWHLLGKLAYKKHPYQWPTIGKKLSHIADASLSDVQLFFDQHYAINNAILSVAGNIKPDHLFQLAEKWFGDIPAKSLKENHIPEEPIQVKERIKEVYADVPLDAIYIAFHMGNRKSNSYYLSDILSDILSGGKSSRLYQNLVQKKHIFNEIDAYLTGYLDPGLLIIEGKPAKGIKINDAIKAIRFELDKLMLEKVENRELQKVKNQIEAHHAFEEISQMNKAFSLAYFEMLGGAELLETEKQYYQKATAISIRDEAIRIFKQQNGSTLIYRSNKKGN